MAGAVDSCVVGATVPVLVPVTVPVAAAVEVAVVEVTRSPVKPLASSGRMFRRAGRVNSPRSVFWPGTVMTSWLLPWICTCAPATPDPLTRVSMIERAWFIASPDGAEPSCVRAVMVMLVPPCRSMPSLGDFEPGVNNTSAYIRTMSPRNTARYRPGRNCAVGPATYEALQTGRAGRCRADRRWPVLLSGPGCRTDCPALTSRSRSTTRTRVGQHGSNAVRTRRRARTERAQPQQRDQRSTIRPALPPDDRGKFQPRLDQIRRSADEA